MKKNIRTVAIDQVPAVIDFVDAQSAIADFKQEHAQVFAQFAELAERYNATLEQAEKVCRGDRVACGPFDLYQFVTKYDAEGLFNAVGRDRFLEIGGKIETVQQFSLDRQRFEAAVAQNKIPKDVVDRVRTETPNYHKPAKVSIP